MATYEPHYQESQPVKLPPLNLYWTQNQHYQTQHDPIAMMDDVFFDMEPNHLVDDLSPSYDQSEGFYFNQPNEWVLDSPSASTSGSPFVTTPTEYQTFQFPPVNDEWVDQLEDEDEGISSPAAVLSCRWVDCKASYGTQEELVQHIERCHVDQRRAEDFTCFWAGCPRRHRPFNARYKLLIHMRVHSGEKPNRCSYEGCMKAFSRLENLKIHLRSHTGEKPYLCQYPTCRKTFSNSSDRAKHQRTHIDTKPYACQVPGCLKRYTDPSSLRKHVKNHVNKQQDDGNKSRTSSVSSVSSVSSTESSRPRRRTILQEDEPTIDWDTKMFTANDVFTQQEGFNQMSSTIADVTVNQAFMDESYLVNEMTRYVPEDNGGWLFPADDVERLCGLPSFV